MALNFYNSFENTPITVKYEKARFDATHSVLILVNDNPRMAIPNWFYKQASLPDPPNYDRVFEKNLNWIDILSYLYEESFTRRYKLVPIDIKILKALTYYKRTPLFKDLTDKGFRNFLFKNSTLAHIVRTSEKWVQTRLEYLRKFQVIQSNFIINPFVFGLNTFVLKYSQEFDHLVKHLEQYTLLKLILSNQQDIVRVFQLPNVLAEDDLVKINPFPEYPIEISEINFFNNLSGLTHETETSFTKIPNFDSIKAPLKRPTIEFKKENHRDWYDNVKSLNDSQYISLSRLKTESRLDSVVKVLRYLAKEGIPHVNFKTSAEIAKIHANHFREAFRFLINHDIIGFFPRLLYIGCPIRYGMYVRCKQKELLNSIYLNILELPHSMLYRGENLLVAYVALPENWVSRFMRYITNLQMDPEVELVYGIIVAFKSWGRYSIPIPKGIEIDEFGVRYPFTEIVNNS